MKFFLIIPIIFMVSCAPKSEILHGKICPNCFADNPVWRKDFCGTCLAWDRKVLTEDHNDAIVSTY
jgi:predicted amidophosphoribosyltransferase